MLLYILDIFIDLKSVGGRVASAVVDFGSVSVIWKTEISISRFILFLGWRLKLRGRSREGGIGGVGWYGRIISAFCRLVLVARPGLFVTGVWLGTSLSRARSWRLIGRTFVGVGQRLLMVWKRWKVESPFAGRWLR